jgi:hypothetical protein
MTDDRGDYTTPDAEFEHSRTREWSHGIGEIVSALAESMPKVEWLHEHTTVAWNLGDAHGLVRRDDGLWEVPGSSLPLSFSLRATSA